MIIVFVLSFSLHMQLDISDDAIKENVIDLLDKIAEHRDNISKGT